MATQSQVQNTLLAATLKVANLVNVNFSILTGGGLTADFCYINLMQRAINCVQRQYDLQDYISAPFILAYNRLLQFVGTYGIGTINPNAQNPNTTITIINNGSTINSTTIPFINQTTVAITNYNTTLAATYGKLPLVCQIYIDNGTDPAYPDFGTAPAINFVVNDNPGSGIASVTWTYPIPTSGYIYLSGVEQ